MYTNERQPRRFSEGMERVPVAAETLRVGRFSDGVRPRQRSCPEAVPFHFPAVVSCAVSRRARTKVAVGCAAASSSPRWPD